MKKIILFPYHPDLRILIEHISSLRDYEINGFVSFKEDADSIQMLNESIGLVDSAYDRLIQESDAIILLDNYRDYKPDKYYQVIEDGLRYNKEILITPLAQAQLDLEKYQGQYDLLERLPDRMDTIEMVHLSSSLLKKHAINVPIIGVIGQGKHCEKFKNQILLKEVLESEYQTITISSNALGVLFGCYTIPSFLFEDIPFEEKIFKYNRFINLLATLCPDVMVLGIPEGIAPFTKMEFHHFAEYPLVITNAVPIDTAVLCTYFMAGVLNEDGLREMMNYCGQKFEIPVSAIAVSRTLYEIPSEEYEKIIYEFLGDSFIREHYPDVNSGNVPILNPLKRDETIATIKMCLGLLQENVNGI